MKFLVIIPARIASTRLPQKPLVDILGKSMLQRTYEQCLKAVDQDKLLIATDSPLIVEHAENLGFNVVLTSEECLTGTDRVAEVANLYDFDYYINVQGDEPLINPQDILKVIDAIHLYPGEIINGYTEIENESDYVSRTIPKVVFRNDGRLLYMSRSPIPGNKSDSFVKAWRQVCIYAFPKKVLADFANQKEKTQIENIEDIEILRFLEMGHEVRMIHMSDQSIAVDTSYDLDKVIKRLNEEH